MKTKLLLLLLLSFHLSSQAQISTSLTDTTKMWSQIYSGWPYGYNIKTDYVKFTGDTLIGTDHYRKVMQAMDSLHMQWKEIGYIREDSSKKVFYRDVHLTYTRLLYDFNVQVGDTLDLYQQGTPTYHHKLMVDTIDSVFIYNRYVKRWVIDNEPWYDGIGSICGVLNSGIYMAVGASYRLLCFNENDTLKFQNPAYNYCYFTYTGIDKPADQNISVNIFPDPVVSTSTITIGKKAGDDNVMEIYSVTGVKIKSILLNKNQTAVLYRSDFSRGLYLYRVILSGSKVISGKFAVD